MSELLCEFSYTVSDNKCIQVSTIDNDLATITDTQMRETGRFFRRLWNTEMYTFPSSTATYKSKNKIIVLSKST